MGDSSERIASLENQIRRQTIAEAVRAYPFHDYSEAIDHLMARAHEHNGKLVVMRTITIEGRQFQEPASLEAAARDLATSKPHWLKGGDAALAAGAGATSSASGTDWSKVKYKDLKSNPGLMSRAIAEKGEAWVTEKQNKYLSKRGFGPR